jgi:hypothetical protein
VLGAWEDLRVTVGRARFSTAASSTQKAGRFLVCPSPPTTARPLYSRYDILGCTSSKGFVLVTLRSTLLYQAQRGEHRDQ